MALERIRNFCIIAHIDHGKSTLADRMLELTGTIEKRKMREQVLDSMELERERGITIKMTPVRMVWKSNHTDSRYMNQDSGKGTQNHESRILNPESSDSAYTLNLIDTPGHIDFSYEVSRALRAVEGAVLLVDATQGVEAQTLSVLSMAREQGLTTIPAVNKIDAPLARVPEVKAELAALLSVPAEMVLEVSGKTGQGVPELLEEIVRRVPPPHEDFVGTRGFRALVFDFKYSNHTGVIVYVRVFDGAFKKGERLRLIAADRDFTPIEAGIFTPSESPVETLTAGEIGYVTTGIKEPGIASVGDTVTSVRDALPALSGYEEPKPVVWASIYPESQDDFTSLRQALSRLRLSDSAFTFEEESSGILGRGFRGGFLGMLHLEIITERLAREFELKLVVTTPSTTYEVVDRRGARFFVHSPARFPEHGMVEEVFEPWVSVTVFLPEEYLGEVMQLLYRHEAKTGATETFGDNRIALHCELPLRELMRGFFDELKSVSAGFASLSYVMGEFHPADVAKLEILVADEVIPAFTRIVSRRRLQEEAEQAVEKLSSVLPRQLFVAKVQAKADGRIIASRTLRALQKDVTGYLYGGDRTRKMKLWKKQAEGKKRLKARGKVNIPADVFLKMMRG